MPLPLLPRVDMIEVEDLSPPDEKGFLRLRRRRLHLRAADRPDSEPFIYDSVDRKALDAVVMAAHYRDSDGLEWVYLRGALRPPIALRPEASRPLPEKETLGAMWELPAGLVEQDECKAGRAGLRRCAARELEEELGFAVQDERLLALGPATFPCGGVIGERHHFFQVEVDPAKRGKPSEDGSVLERDAVVAALPLHEAIALCRSGEIEDAKTELALRRLSETLGRSPEQD